MDTHTAPAGTAEAGTADVPLLTREQVAGLLATTPRHIERLVDDGRLGSCRVGRFIRFSLSDVLTYLDQTHIPAASDQRIGGSR